jgi:hypothetical protein
MNYSPVPEIKEINTYIINLDINLLKQKSIITTGITPRLVLENASAENSAGCYVPAYAG